MPRYQKSLAPSTISPPAMPSMPRPPMPMMGSGPPNMMGGAGPPNMMGGGGPPNMMSRGGPPNMMGGGPPMRSQNSGPMMNGRMMGPPMPPMPPGEELPTLVYISNILYVFMCSQAKCFYGSPSCEGLTNYLIYRHIKFASVLALIFLRKAGIFFNFIRFVLPEL